MSWKSVGKKIGGMGLRVLGGSLAGGAGVQVGGMIAATLGLEDDSPEAVEAALSADPEALVKLKQFEMEHQVKLEGIALDELKAHLADTDSARKRQVEYAKATGKQDLNQAILGWAITGGFLGLLGVLLVYAPPQENAELLYIAAGALLQQFGSVTQFYFGSSQGSKNKTNMLANNGVVR